MSIYDYSTTPSSNSTIDGTNIAEGCSPGNVNNAIRSLMADMAQLFSDTGGSLDTTGSANTYVAASAQSFSAYSDGMTLRVRINVTNTGASTINVDSVGAASIKKIVGAAAADVAAGDLQAGGVYDLSYDSGNSYFILAGFTPYVFSGARFNGDVMIGASGTPGASLEVYEATDTKVIKLHGNSTSGAFMTAEDANTTGTGYVRYGAIGDAAYITAGNVDIAFFTDTGFRINGTGGASSFSMTLRDRNDSFNSEFILYGDGDIENTNNSYGGISDQRLKENITNASSQWSDIKNIRLKNYNLIGDDQRQLGVIAQDLIASGMSGLVKTNPETNMYSVKYSVLFTKALGALQEAIQRIERLEAA